MPYLIQATPEPEPLDCRILTSALELFMKKGYHKVSVHEIQKNARVSIGSIYNHFGGKEGIAQALYNHILGETEQLVDQQIALHDSARNRCEGIISALFAYTETHPNIIGYVFHAKHADFLPDRAALCESAAFVKMQEIIKTGMRQSEFRHMNPAIAMAMVFGGPIRLIQQRLDGIIDKPLVTFQNEIFTSIWSGIAKSQP